MSESRPTVLVISSGYHLYREYLLADIAEHADVWLLLDREPTWEQAYLVGSSLVDTLDTDAVLAAAEAVAASRGIDGVISWDELRMINAATVSAALGLPGGEVEAVRRCRDKHLTRTSLHAFGVPQPRSIAAGSVDGAIDAGRQLGYPVVVKPRALGASIGVSKADTVTELIAAYEQASAAWEDGVPPNDSVLIEECVTGSEISVDCAVIDGVAHPMFLARKRLGFEPYCEEVGHVVDARDPLLSSPRLRALLVDAHRAVGLRTAITHTEVMLTADGPKIIEINCRLGGDLIPYVASVATGLAPGRIAVEVATGRTPELTPTAAGVARIDFVYPQSDTVVEAVEIDEAAARSGVHRVVALAQPGQLLELPPAGHVSGRYGYLVTAGSSPAACADAATAALSLIRLTTRVTARAW